MRNLLDKFRLKQKQLQNRKIELSSELDSITIKLQVIQEMMAEEEKETPQPLEESNKVTRNRQRRAASLTEGIKDAIRSSRQEEGASLKDIFDYLESKNIPYGKKSVYATMGRLRNRDKVITATKDGKIARYRLVEQAKDA